MIQSVRAWLDGREPRPPADLRDRLLDALEASSPADLGRAAGQGDAVDDPGPDGGAMEALLAAAESALTSAASRPGRVRASAFELLVADALITYACEAALETEAPERALASVLALGDAT